MPTDPILNTFLSLIVLVAALAGILFLVKKFALKHSKSKFSQNGLEILAKIPLQPKATLFIIKVENKKLLIGVNDNSINTLAELDNEKDIHPQIANKKIRKNIQKSIPTDNPNLSFKAFLNQTFKKS